MNLAYKHIWIYWSVLAALVFNGLFLYCKIYVSDDVIEADPALKRFLSLKYRYITIWNVFLQVFYIMLSLRCEIDDLNKESQWKHRQIAGQYRTTLFCAIVYPTTLTLCGLFWGLYFYDRELILPSFTDKLVHPLNNHVVHTVVVIFVLLEVAYNPRRPENHWHHVKLQSYLQLVFAVTVFFTKWERGVYPYAFMDMVSPTDILLMLAFSYLLSMLVYMTQWKLAPVLKGFVERKIKIL